MKKSKILSCFCGVNILTLISPALLTLASCGGTSTSKGNHIIVTDTDTKKTLETDELSCSFSLNLKSAPSGGQQISVDKYYIMSGSSEGVTDNNLLISEVTTDGKLLNFTVSFTPPLNSNSKSYVIMFGIVFICKEASTGTTIWTQTINNFKLSITIDKKNGSVATITNLVGSKINSMSKDSWNFYENTAGNIEIEFSVASGYVYNSFNYICKNCSIVENTTKKQTNKFYGIISWSKTQATTAMTEGMELTIKNPASLVPTKFEISEDSSPDLHIKTTNERINLKCVLKDSLGNRVLLPETCSLELSSSASSEQTFAGIISIDDYNVHNTGIFTLSIGFKTNDEGLINPVYDTQYKILYDVIKVSDISTGVHTIEQSEIFLTLDSEQIKDITGIIQTDGHSKIANKTSITWKMKSNQVLNDLFVLYGEPTRDTGYDIAYYGYYDSDGKEYEATKSTPLKDGRTFTINTKKVEVVDLSGTFKVFEHPGGDKGGWLSSNSWSCTKYEKFGKIKPYCNASDGWHFSYWYEEGKEGVHITDDSFVLNNDACYVAVFEKDVTQDINIYLKGVNGSILPTSFFTTNGCSVGSILSQVTKYTPDNYYTTTGGYWLDENGEKVSTSTTRLIWNDNTTFTYYFQFDYSQYNEIKIVSNGWNFGSTCYVKKNSTLKQLRDDKGWTDQFLITTLNKNDEFYAGWYDENDNLLSDNTILEANKTYYVKSLKTSEYPLELDLSNLNHDLGSHDQKFTDVSLGKISIIQPAASKYKRFLSKNEYDSFTLTLNLLNKDSGTFEQIYLTQPLTSRTDTEFNININSSVPSASGEYYMILGKTYTFALSLKINDTEYIPTEEEQNKFKFNINDLTNEWNVTSKTFMAQVGPPISSVKFMMTFTNSSSVIFDREEYNNCFTFPSYITFNKDETGASSPATFVVKGNTLFRSGSFESVFDEIEEPIEEKYFNYNDKYSTNYSFVYKSLGSEQEINLNLELSSKINIYMLGTIKIKDEYSTLIKSLSEHEVNQWFLNPSSDGKFIYSSVITESPFYSWITSHTINEKYELDYWYYLDKDEKEVELKEGDTLVNERIYYPHLKLKS